LVIQIILTNKILRNRSAFEHQEVGSLIDFSNPPIENFGRKTKLPPESAARKFLASVDFPYLIVDESHSWTRGTPTPTPAARLVFLRDTLLPKVAVPFFLSGSLYPSINHHSRPRFRHSFLIRPFKFSVRQIRFSIQLSLRVIFQPFLPRHLHNNTIKDFLFLELACNRTCVPALERRCFRDCWTESQCGSSR
jgi:hypothetical protein